MEVLFCVIIDDERDFGRLYTAQEQARGLVVKKARHKFPDLDLDDDDQFGIVRAGEYFISREDFVINGSHFATILPVKGAYET